MVDGMEDLDKDMNEGSDEVSDKQGNDGARGYGRWNRAREGTWNRAREGAWRRIQKRT
jgi:hypothetical protein